MIGGRQPPTSGRPPSTRQRGWSPWLGGCVTSVLGRPWGPGSVGVAVALIALADVLLGYLAVPGLVDPQRTVRRGAPFTPPRLTEAVLDESAHAATALILLKAARLDGISLTLAVLAGAVLIDADHVPMELGASVITRGTNRPYSHSLAMVAAMLALAGISGGRWRRWLLGVAFGIATHLLRDMATGGVPLFWPFLASRTTIDYWAYGVVVLLGGMLASWWRRRGWTGRGRR